MIDQIVRRSRRALLAVVVYGVALFWINHIPLTGLGIGVGNDKVAHFWAYGLLAFLLAWCVYPSRRGRLTGYLGLLAVVALYGAADEVLQHFVPQRDADVADWVADLIGAAVGLAFHATTAAAIGRLREALSESAAESNP